ncbi:hypothetical protein AAFF_G00272070 [Aldrovandia affinis]|uniref:YEATS domain-containing protein n=1 Tax=Aldrovandia affinis TaxID=143900 RepID=A0AAD7RDE6_9TELE|nr:hypothetical protein AAFF_G00272070 [Aldrovandia affinis]
MTHGRAQTVCKDPPYKVEESGYAGFILPIEVYFKNKEEPKKVRFDYDLFLHLDGHPPVNHLRCEKLTFNKPTEEFCRKLMKAGGHRDPHKRSSEDSKVMVMQEGASSLFRQHLKLPALHSGSVTLTFSDAKKTKPSHGSKVTADLEDGSGNALTTSSGSSAKPLKPAREHRDRPFKDSRQPKSAFQVLTRELYKQPKDPSKKPKENQPLKGNRPKMGFKEPKAVSKETRSEGHARHGAETAGLQHNGKPPAKRSATADAQDHVTKKRKKELSDPAPKPPSGSSSPRRHSVDRRLLKDGRRVRAAERTADSEPAERNRPVPTLPPFQDLVDPNDSDTDDNTSPKYEVSEALRRCYSFSLSEVSFGLPVPIGLPASLLSEVSFVLALKVNIQELYDSCCLGEPPPPSQSGVPQCSPFLWSEQPSPVNSSCSSKSSLSPPHKRQVLDPLRSIIRDLHSEDEESSESEEDDDSETHSDQERPLHTHLAHRYRRVSLSDGSHSEKSSACSPPSLWNDPPALLKPCNNQVLEGKSPGKQGKLDKKARNVDGDKAYLDELVELHRRLMALRERHVLQQIVNLIEETGHFHLTNTTFDFDLCSLDRPTVRKLQSYLETSGAS